MKFPTKDWANQPKRAATRQSASGPPVRYLRFRQLKEIIPWCRSTVYRAVRDKRFPAPVQLSKNTVAWRSDRVMDWLERRERS